MVSDPWTGIRENRGTSIPILEQPVAEGETRAEEEACGLGEGAKAWEPDRGRQRRRGQDKQMIKDNKTRSQQE